MTNTIEDRLRALEATIKAKGCAVCRDWPAIEFLYDASLIGGPPADASAYAEHCPCCGRPGPLTMRFQAVPAREAAL
jgi:hypothetical protein